MDHRGAFERRGELLTGEAKMPFRNDVEAEQRLSDPRPLTPDEVRDFTGWYQVIGTGGMRRLTVELALRNLLAVQKFDRSTSRLTWAIAILTAVMALPVIFSWIKALWPSS